jgi:hypothetical protein
MTMTRGMLLAAASSSALYFVLATRFALRIATPGLNSSSRGYFTGVLVMTVVLYVAGMAVAVSQRRREAAGIPIIGAALFGSFVCVVFYGP